MPKLSDIIICYRCKTEHKRLPLKQKEEARCTKCDALLYKSLDGLEYKVFSYSFTALVFFFVSLLYPIIEINFSGYESFLNIPQAIFLLYQNGYFIVSFFALLVLVLFPGLLMFFLFLFSLFIILKINKSITKTILKILGVLKHWSMLDIFFVSILVALVKIFDYAVIEFDVAFVSLVIYILIELYLTRHIYLETLWDLWEKTYE